MQTKIIFQTSDFSDFVRAIEWAKENGIQPAVSVPPIVQPVPPVKKSASAREYGPNAKAYMERTGETRIRLSGIEKAEWGDDIEGACGARNARHDEGFEDAPQSESAESEWTPRPGDESLLGDD